MKFLRRDEKGFTLIEALIVVIIVAILAVLGIARFLGVREATAEATCQSHLSTLNASIKKYELDTGVPFVPTDPPATGAAGTGATAWDAVQNDAGDPVCPSDVAAVYSAEPTAVTGEYEAGCSATNHGVLSAWGVTLP